MAPFVGMTTNPGDAPSAFDLWRAQQPKRTRRQQAAKLARELVRPAVLSVAAGALVGFGLFFLGSSRGLDMFDLEELLAGLLALAFGVGSGVLLILSIVGRAPVGFVAAALMVVLSLTSATTMYANGLRLVPGTTTDGRFVVTTTDTVTAAVEPNRTSSRATCWWGGGVVVRVAARGLATWNTHAQATIELDAVAKTGRAVLQDRLNRSTSTLDGSVDVNLGTTGLATFGSSTVEWTCPPMP
jgi:hypothetical protein